MAATLRLAISKIDDLWNYGKPTGWGSIWQDEIVNNNAISDPFLMTGFDKKTAHYINKGKEEVEFTIEFDVLGNEEWNIYKTIYSKPRHLYTP